jgi:hypothetical protein
MALVLANPPLSLPLISGDVVYVLRRPGFTEHRGPLASREPSPVPSPVSSPLPSQRSSTLPSTPMTAVSAATGANYSLQQRESAV